MPSRDPAAAGGAPRRARRTAPALTAVALGAIAACAGGEASDGTGRAEAPGGTVVVATVGEPDALLPPLVMSLQGAQVSSLLFDRLAEIGPELNTVGDAGFQPRLARRWWWTGADSLAIAFAVDPRARWHDGAPVTSRDVRFSFQLYTDAATGSPVGPLLANVDSVSSPHDSLAVVHFRRRSPQQFFDVAYQLYVLPEHLLRDVPRAQLAASDFARQPVGSGRFRFGSWERGAKLQLVADTANWRGRPQLDRLIWTMNPDPGAATRALVTGAADVWESVRGEGVAMVARTPTLRAVTYPSLDQGFLAFNLRTAGGSAAHPLLGDRALRRALAAAVDRDRLVRSVFDTLAVARSIPAPQVVAPQMRDVLGPSFDLVRAGRELDALGWRDGDGDGVRERAGQKLELRLLVPTSSAVRRQMAVLVQEQLRQVGAQVTIDAVDPAAFYESMRRGKWDVVLDAWHSDPAPAAILQRWGAPGRAGRGGANFGNYRSAQFEALVDSASTTFDRARAAELYGRAYATLADDAPAVFLYELRNVAGMHRRLEPAAMRADAWWAGLAEWRIPADRREARDRAGTLAARR